MLPPGRAFLGQVQQCREAEGMFFTLGNVCVCLCVHACCMEYVYVCAYIQATFIPCVSSSTVCNCSLLCVVLAAVSTNDAQENGRMQADGAHLGT